MSAQQGADGLLARVAERLGATEPHFFDYGVTKSVGLSIEGRDVEILHGRELAVEVALGLPDFPASVTITFAPRGLYDRAKLLECIDPSAHPVMGHEAFDRLFVVLGIDQGAVDERLARVVPTLADAERLRPSAEQLKLKPGAPPQRRLFLRTRPPAHKATGADDAADEAATLVVRETLALATAFERAWRGG